MKKIIAVVFAREKSKGLKNKNLLKFNNISLVELAIKQAKSIKLINEVYISSDSKKIIKNAVKQKAIVPFIRPKKLASDKSAEILSWKHFINYLKKKRIKADYIVSIPPTAPLRSSSDIKNCIKLAIKKKYDVVLTITKSSKNPFFNMLMKKNNKFKLMINKNTFFRRQDAPTFFDITTVCYVFKPDFIENNNNLFSGKLGFVNVPKERAIDIDDKVDFKIASLLSKYGKN